MGRAIFMGEQSNGLPAAGMLVPGYSAEQQGPVEGLVGGKRMERTRPARLPALRAAHQF